MRLTDISIKALKPPPKGAQIYSDDTLTGFGVRVSEGGTKSYVLTHGTLRRRETIGRVAILGLQDARAEAKRRLAEYTLGKTLTGTARWNTAVDQYLEEGRARLKARTLKDYRRSLKHFRFGDLNLNEVSPIEIQRRLDKLSGTPVEQHHTFTVLRTFLRWAHQKHYIDKHPMERMASRYRYRPRERILADEELVKVWKATNDDTFGHIVKLLILTGQRVGELSKLSREMIGEDSVTLPSGLTKNGREHRFPKGKLATKYLPASRFPLTVRARGASFTSYSRHKRKLDEASGVRDWTLHDLRRTFASGLASLGVSLPVIERLLNHVSGSFAGIVGVYQRYDYAKEMREAVAKWENHLQTLIA